MSRIRLRLLAAIGAVSCALALATAPPAGAVTHPAGSIGSSIVIARAADLIGDYDVAANSAGTAYIGWITNSGSPDFRQVHLCTLPVAARTCSGGVQTIPAGGSTATDLRVLLTSSGTVLLVWFRDGDHALDGPQGGEIAEATAASGLHLTAATAVASAPSHGELLDAELSPGGSLYTVAYSGVGTTAVQVRSAPSSPYVTLHSHYSIGEGQLAFAGNTPVLAITKYGAVSTPAGWTARASNGSWSAFANVAATWTTGGLTLVRTAHGTRLITGINDASYHPVLAAWNGHGFNRRVGTVDKSNCGPSSHDGTTDASGRLLDVSWECNDVTIANYADGAHAALTRIHVPGTPTATPQIGSGRRGIATVAWSNENAKGGSDLHVSRVRLATATRTVHGHATGGACTSAARSRACRRRTPTSGCAAMPPAAGS